MTASSTRPYAAFRLNLEQQKKRAKDLLKAVKAGDAAARVRLERHCRRAEPGEPAPAPQLSQAQHCIARELRFASWRTLKAHIAAMERARGALGRGRLDDDCPTMHIRCGDDLRGTLREAGFEGTFNRHINPYHEGPVTDAPDWLEQRARFIADSAGPYLGLDYDDVLEGCRAEERALARASREFERVVLWLEHDRYDQFVLLRCLAWFAEHGAPPRLELVGPNDFPGAAAFTGLGQLPPEALPLLWRGRRRLGAEHLAIGHHAWRVFRSPDPRKLVEIMRQGTALLPDLAGALRRHLEELPSPPTGLGLTQQLLLETLAELESLPAGRLVERVMRERDPLPGLGDIAYDQVLRAFSALPEPLVARSGGHPPPEWRNDTVSITERGRALLAGRLHWLTLPVPPRWVGGVEIAPGRQNWHWNEQLRRAELK